MQNGCKLSNTETVAHTLRIEVKKKPEMCATVPHGVTRPSPDPSEGFSQLFTELPSSPIFPQKKKITLLVGNAPPHHLQIKALHISDLNKIKYSTNFAQTEGWRLQAEEA